MQKNDFTLVKKIMLWSLADLHPYDKNPRIHSEEQVAQIAASIVEFGFNNPILVDADNNIVAGHGRLAAARQLQLDQVPVIQLGHLTASQQRAYRIADNKLTENGSWHFDLLDQEFKDLELEDFDISLTGFDWDDLQAQQEFASDSTSNEEVAEEATEGLIEREEAPELNEVEVVSRLGDVWLLGEHRVLCGDATDPACLERLLNGEAIDLIFTDPPYNVDYEGYTSDKLTIKNDKLSDEEFRKFLLATFAACSTALKPEGSMYVCHGSSYQRDFQDALEANGFKVRNQIIWAKHHFAWGHGRYKFQHEPIFYCHKKGQSDAWYGDKSQSTLWSVDKPSANRLHPTMKPVALVEIAVKNSSQRGQIVLDLFGGSGSTLIACEQYERRSFTMELDPRYVDVIVKRWQEWSGKEAVCENEGGTFAEIACKRTDP